SAALVVVIAGSVAGLAGLWRHAEDQRQAAVDSAAEADRQRERTETSYQLARGALTEVMTLQHDPRFRDGPLEDVRRRLRQAEAAFYQKFVALQGEDPKFQTERATALLNLGFLTGQLHSAQDAIPFYRQAIAVCEALARHRP